ncbi:FecR family protein [Carboxylicivirga marina]|uniref:FecR domain-containing protein n=2 Tax=Carboxylicivirga marina TaxID=2800988 RepID=A0ABS1HQ65_9BACT|nr:FecR family protein [Carboxylicivirga marina]MBK3519827.1 FecR domain-containing protein [Carboxylicivirga marina]
MKKENENISWELLAKDVSGELNHQEHLQLQKDLETNPDIEKQVKKLWGDAHYAQALNHIDTNNAWNSVKKEIHTKNTSRLKIYYSIAAVLLIALATSVFFTLFTNQQETIIITSQNTEQVTLPDGTIVDLNYGSQISYPKNFNSDIREVKLTGEAFFDVARDENKPFVIETAQLKIEVLGTSFNVKAYKGATDSEVIVSSGRVMVDAKLADNNVVLEAGDAVKYSSLSNTLSTHKIHSPNYKAWKTKEIEFNNTQLSDVFTTIEKTYHIKIELDSLVNIDNEKLNATFSQYSLDHVLDAVCATFNLQYSKKADVYLIQTKQ